MKLKTKFILSGVLLVFGSLFSLFFTTGLSEVLTHEATTLQFLSPGLCIAQMASNRQSLLLFLCFVGFFLLLDLLLLTTNTKPYRSTLMSVTPDIQIPAAVGQYQHGSAHFLTQKEKDKAFDSFILDPTQKKVKYLLKSGYKNLEFIKDGHDINNPADKPTAFEKALPSESGKQND